jgi:hypothetical protein
MRITRSKLLGMLLLLVSFSAAAVGQEQSQVFALPEARAGDLYRVELEKVLREKYRLKLESGTQTATIRWALAGGELPPGMSVRAGGVIVGTSRNSSDQAYNIRLKAIDESTPSDELLLDFTLKVKPPALRLVQIGGPRLVPIEEVAARSAPATSAALVVGETGSTPITQTNRSRTNPAKPGETTPQTPVGAPPGGKKEEPAALNNTESLSSKYMRAIIGIEQSGVSSGSSAQNPFVDFFFNAGLTKGYLSAWGDVRLTTTPQQVTAFVSAASNVAGAATGTKLNDLASSFNFKMGPEYLLTRGSDAKIRTSVIAGFGAASLLTAPAQSGQIFKLPSPTSSQSAAFLAQYPEAKTPGAAFIAFVPLERDRFFRQYFMGLRIKSYHQEGFPSMLDVTFGQNSAVTGGQLRHFVLGIDGSYRLKLMDNAFYIFGSANLKVGGPKYSGTPFILDPAETTVKLSDSNVVITSRQSNRDFYRIGFGVDLIGLFKKAN